MGTEAIMAGVDLLNVAISGLQGSQSGLDTTANNISNVNTEGYSRQRVEFTPLGAVPFGNNFFGAGVDVQSVTRIIDQIATLELRTSQSDFEQLSAFAGLATRLDEVLGDENLGLSSALQGFFDAIHGVASDPSSLAQREVMFHQIQAVSQRFNNLYANLQQMAESTNQQIASVVAKINTLGQNIAALNEDIIAAKGQAQGAPNDLLDRRDNLIRELSGLVKVFTVEQDDGAVNVFIGNGQGLVVGVNSTTLATTTSGERPGHLDIVLQNGSTQIDITANIEGGKLGGLRTFRDDMLEPAINRIGKVALALADQINRQHRLGIDLNGQLGGDVFTDINATSAQQARVAQSPSNTGTLDVQLRIDDTNLLTDDNYRLSFDGVNFQLTNDRTGSVVSTFPPPGATPATISVPSEGFSIVINGGTANAGDRFFIQPTRLGALQLATALTTPEQIAAANPIRFTARGTNSGSGALVSVDVTDTTTAAFSTPGTLSPPLEIQFTSVTAYNVVDPTGPTVLGSGVFTPGQENNVLAGAGLSLGYEIVMKGAPAAGDVFDVTFNSGGVGDNRNAEKLAALQTSKVMEQGSADFQQSYLQLVSRVGAQTQESLINRDAAQSLVRAAESRRQQASGVNLDEEAANLIRFQQAYQASAQVISVARNIFQTLIDSV
ncbi:MAG: flagellar hook-associated protein FlgK [Gammaproteobacteria bacterium]|nr:MAG: flagellar hook-associated protein FlgK [Gammaproteobacteria bacterium]